MSGAVLSTIYQLTTGYFNPHKTYGLSTIVIIILYEKTEIQLSNLIKVTQAVNGETEIKTRLYISSHYA